MAEIVEPDVLYSQAFQEAIPAFPGVTSRAVELTEHGFLYILVEELIARIYTSNETDSIY